MIMGRSLTGTSTSRHATACRRRRVAHPSAARTFLTQLHCSPSIGTRYHRPPQSAIPSGKRTIRPERRPATSRVTQRFGISPRPNAAAHRCASRRAGAPAIPRRLTLRRDSARRGRQLRRRPRLTPGHGGERGMPALCCHPGRREGTVLTIKWCALSNQGPVILSGGCRSRRISRASAP